ncbi:MAG: NUDIX hydrolase [Acidobacteria bacterium]|nr:NUDIX hydrolase [Acidobacteriota bacterium]MDW7984977.1 NUDIX hydrolase [Acidobacteriota bacterium]
MHVIPEIGYALTADVLVVARKPSPQVLLVQRGRPPFEGTWAIPGGFLEPHERVATCAVRELAEETGICVQESDLLLVGIYDAPGRDPRGRVITVAYAVVVPFPIEVQGGDDAARAAWFPVDHLPPLAFDHDVIIRDSLAHLRRLGFLL